MIVFAETIGPRLRYITEFIGMQLWGKPIELTSDAEAYKQYNGPRINYSRVITNAEEIRVIPHLLLTEVGVKQQDVACFRNNGKLYFFPTEGDIPFDMFSAAFYLLSRYEEYLPHEKDPYGRYAHENSLAYREGFLDQPLVNMWVKEFRDVLIKKFPSFKSSDQNTNAFSFLPTYDIDEAWAYKHKTWSRSTGGAVRDLLKGDWKRFRERRQVLNGRLPDPYDSFDWIFDLHRPLKLKPKFFFLVAEKNGRYDKNNLPVEKAFQSLVRKIADQFPIGLHPSWQSGDDEELLAREKDRLERISGYKVTASRQHYIRFSLPETYRRLIAAGIEEDHSMGYGSINGFRASVASPFYWYDLLSEKRTNLRLFPFCFMEANSFFEQKQDPQQAFEELCAYRKRIAEAGGTLISIWHNTFLGTEKKFKGWREVYGEFVRKS